MPKLKCTVCKRLQTIETCENKCLDRSGGPYCCCADCAADWIRQHPLQTITIDHEVIHLNPDHDCPDGCVYSETLDMSFKSHYEQYFAEEMHKRGLRFWYEPIIFVFRGKEYTPDFIFHDHGVLVEVKGLWQAGKRNKLKLFREVFPHFPLLVIPWVCRESYFPANQLEAIDG